MFSVIEIKLGFISTRYVVLVVLMVANTLSYTIRTNMSVTIVAMVKNEKPSNTTVWNNTNVNYDPEDSCPVSDQSSSSTESVSHFCFEKIIFFLNN